MITPPTSLPGPRSPRRSDDDDTPSTSVIGCHKRSPTWSPKVSARKLSSPKLNRNPCTVGKLKEIPPFKPNASQSKLESDREQPGDSSVVETTEVATDEDVKGRKVVHMVPPSPQFKRRPVMSAKLSHLATNGKYPAAMSRLPGRTVYHSTTW